MIATACPASSPTEALTYTALDTFRNCPRKYRLRYVEGLRPRDRVETLAFGSVIHGALELWHSLPASDGNRLFKVQDYLDFRFGRRAADPVEKRQWHVAQAMMTGYAGRYAAEEFEVVALEKKFKAEVRNPETGRSSQTFHMEGKCDGIVRVGGELYLLEHKTASTLDGNYLDKLWTDTQIALYSYYLRQAGFPIVGVLYNVLLKSRLEQRQGESEEEYCSRSAALAARNKSGKSSAKRQEPETDEEYAARLAGWYGRPEAFHRERIYLSEDRLAMLQEEVWEVTQQYLDARRRGKWLLNTSSCFSFQRPCEYLPYCRSNFSEIVRGNLFDLVPPHEELSESAAPAEAGAAF